MNTAAVKMNRINNSGKLALYSILLSYTDHTNYLLFCAGLGGNLAVNTAAVKVLRTISFLGGNSLLSSRT